MTIFVLKQMKISSNTKYELMLIIKNKKMQITN